MSQDLAFEALCEVCNIDWQEGITQDQRGRVNAALKQLRSLYGPEDLALPMMIHERAAAWAVVYPEIPVTPQSLTGNWGSIIPAAQEKQEAEKQKERERQAKGTNQHARKGCATCGDDHIVSIGHDANGNELTAPCPDCNPHADTTFWVERRKVETIDSAKVREFLNG